MRVALLTIVSASSFASPTAGALHAGRVAVTSRPSDMSVSLVPEPAFLRISSGTFVWPPTLRIRSDVPRDSVSAQLLRAAHSLRRDAVVVTSGSVDASLVLNRATDPGLGAEGYELKVTPSGFEIRANASGGLFYGLQTLLQATNRDGGGNVATPVLEVRDRPRFRWRALHLDVSRHFFSVETVKRVIDVAARYKLNVFHWHLTDDDGWRIEVPSLPRLTSRGSCDSRGRRCGFYTEAMVREVVSYAAARHVDIVPEIDLPGHVGAALRAYPELGCAEATRPTALCPTSETLSFIGKVLEEVVDLFPGRFVHLGGDEVQLTDWRKSAAVRELIRSGRVASVLDVESYILAAAEEVVRRHGRRPVVWDDALAGSVPEDVLIVAWRGTRATALAVRSGHDVVVNSDGPLYFDGYQGDPALEPPAMRYRATLEQVYRFSPIPSLLRRPDAERVVGVQADLWTEQVATPRHLFYMLLPRALALSEVAWSNAAVRSWDSFQARLPAQLDRLRENGYPFRIPEVSFALPGVRAAFFEIGESTQSGRAMVRDSRIKLSMSAAVHAPIRYTLDGSDPTARSPLYTSALSLGARAAPSAVKAAVFLDSSERGPVET